MTIHSRRIMQRTQATPTTTMAKLLLVISLLLLTTTTSSSSSAAASTASSPKSNKPKRINFHKHKPPVPPAGTTLAELEEELNNVPSSDEEMISATIDQVTLDSPYSSQVILKYKPDRKWLWKRWHGTILQSSLLKVLQNMIITAILCLILRKICSLENAGAQWELGLEPSAKCTVIAKLKTVDKLWLFQKSLTTFILTFFLGEAFRVWREMYKLGRGIQGHLSSIGIILATHAARTTGGNNNNSQFTEAAQSFLSTTARHLRLFHILTWASVSRQFQVLLTTKGMTQMMQRGLLTVNELDTLLQLPISPTQRHNAVLEWIILECNAAREAGVLTAGVSYPKVLLQKINDLRGTAASVGDLVDGRIPLAYTHIVQILVDSFLFLAPLALFSELGVWSVVCVAFMTLFYQGLLDLAKIFLDPLNNEDYCEGGMDMDLGVFIRESNAGSLKWMQGLTLLPNDLMVTTTTAMKTKGSSNTAGQSTTTTTTPSDYNGHHSSYTTSQ